MFSAWPFIPPISYPPRPSPPSFFSLHITPYHTSSSGSTKYRYAARTSVYVWVLGLVSRILYSGACIRLNDLNEMADGARGRNEAVSGFTKSDGGRSVLVVSGPIGMLRILTRRFKVRPFPSISHRLLSNIRVDA